MRKQSKLRPYRVDYFDIEEMKDTDLALVRSSVVRAVTATTAAELVAHPRAEGIIAVGIDLNRLVIIRAYRFYKNLSHKNDVYKAVEDLFPANEAIKVMERVEAYRAAPAAPALPVPDVTHATRLSDSSLYDEVCVNCGATDTSGKLDQPCPAPVDALKVQIAAVAAARETDMAQNLSGPTGPATVAAVTDLQGIVAHDARTYGFLEASSVPEPYPLFAKVVVFGGVLILVIALVKFFLSH